VVWLHKKWKRPGRIAIPGHSVLKRALAKERFVCERHGIERSSYDGFDMDASMLSQAKMDGEPFRGCKIGNHPMFRVSSNTINRLLYTLWGYLVAQGILRIVAVVAFSKPIPAHCQKTSAVYENPEVRKGKGLVLTMRGLSKKVGCNNHITRHYFEVLMTICRRLDFFQRSQQINLNLR
jgi:hypothetical protein